MRWLQILFAGMLLTLAPVGAPAARAADVKAVEQVNVANQHYETGEFEAALNGYEQAEAYCPECPELAYNEGLAYYRLKDLERAREKFNEALMTTDPDLESRAKYNLGNVAYSEALAQQEEDTERAIDSARMARDFYLDALQINPDDRDARANVEMAQRLIQRLIQKQQQQQQQNQNQQKEQNQDQNDEQQQQDQQQDQQQQDPNQQGNQDQQQDSEEQNQQQNQQQQENDQQQQQQQSGEQDQDQQEPQSGQQSEQQQQPSEQDQQAQQGQGQKTDPRQLTEEEAERLLQAVRDKEAQRRRELARMRRAQRVRVERDW